MKILLIHPPLENLVTAGIPTLVGKRGFFPAMGILYIAAYCRKYTDHSIDVIDAVLEGIDHSQLADIIKLKKPDLVGISTLTFTLVNSIKTAEMVKSILPDVKVVLGGIHVTLFQQESIANSCIDFAVIGEGEITFSRLLDNINNEKELRKIPGLLFKHNNEIINTGPPSVISDLDSLPFPARELTAFQNFKSYEHNTYATTMITSRGCPYNCLFCYRPHYDKKLRFRSPEDVLQEIEECIELGIREIHFYDDIFTIDRDRVLQLCDLILGTGLSFYWSIMTRVDQVDPQLLLLMKKAGCVRIRFGVESGNDEILKVLRKRITVEQARAAFRMTREAGISTVAYFVIGSPTETEEQIRETISLARDLKADFTNFSIITLYPGTDLYKLALEKKILKEDIWRKFAADPDMGFIPPFWEEKFRREQLIGFQSQAYKAIYLKPGYIIRKLAKIRNFRSFCEMFNLAASMLKSWLKVGQTE